ncbi:hypothetical protein [Aquimarina sp. 2304DJ70-9]|uniref:hypothetical protein n=1 Tax=Aquimarina penaris TaxID=3231044 RepID=UPI0034624006
MNLRNTSDLISSREINPRWSVSVEVPHKTTTTCIGLITPNVSESRCFKLKGLIVLLEEALQKDLSEESASLLTRVFKVLTNELYKKNDLNTNSVSTKKKQWIVALTEAIHLISDTELSYEIEDGRKLLWFLDQHKQCSENVAFELVWGNVEDMFRMGGLPCTNFLSINSKREIKEVLWLEHDFTHSYGIDRLWLTNEWLEDPILLYICKQSGGDVTTFERFFYSALDPYKYQNLLLTVEEVLPVFIKIRDWIQSQSYIHLVDLLEQKGMLPVYLRYFKKKELEQDLDTLIEKLNSVSLKDKIFKEISF